MSLLTTKEFTDCRCIFFDELELSARIGVHPEEQNRTQKILVWLKLYLPQKNASSPSDNIKHVLDYDNVRAGITAIVSERHFYLQETLIDKIAAFCIELRNIKAVEVKIAKVEAYENCKAVGIEVIKWK
ncbi:MAG: hypothetical protein CBC42_02340 [Betaproteobacteria bacterium TMED82]|nr:MAG: hypothetical protein CBC42_02340 [Betaproteobacteria bacterium TMED82]|tara:strand:+ start:41219 stop:41605 length:387 start_codon:yes stop_codon:yes gene_type:complete